VTARRQRGAALLLLALPAALAWACDEGAQGQPSARRRPSASARTLQLVTVQGCVMDAGAMPSHAAVHAMSPAGRLLATAHPDERGVWRMQVPVRAELRLVLGTASANARPVLALHTGVDDLVVDTCVVDLH
jgi:hypothetical protein